MRVIKNLLHRGFILLPEGAHSNVISFTLPLTITREAADIRRSISSSQS